MRRVGWVNRVRRFDVFAVILLAGSSAVAARGETARSAAQGMPPGPGMPGPPTAALSGTGLILGRVIDAGSSAPVRDAVVTLAPVPALPPTSTGLVVPPARDAQSVVTASDGRFLFRDLPAGQFNLSVRTSTAQNAAGQGYGSRRPGGASQAISLGENEKMRDVTFRVWQSAVLSGAVTDETGEPAVGVTVTAMRVDYVGPAAPGSGGHRHNRRSWSLSHSRTRARCVCCRPPFHRDDTASGDHRQLSASDRCARGTRLDVWRAGALWHRLPDR